MMTQDIYVHTTTTTTRTTPHGRTHYTEEYCILYDIDDVSAEYHVCIHVRRSCRSIGSSQKPQKSLLNQKNRIFFFLYNIEKHKRQVKWHSYHPVQCI